jgi:hypothetical protein
MDGSTIMPFFQLRNSTYDWTNILPDPTVIVYRPWAQIADLLDGGKRGLGYATLEWEWGETIVRGDRVNTLQQFCPAPYASRLVHIRSLIDEFGTDGRRTQKRFRGIMARPEIGDHVQRMTREFVRGMRVSFTELIEPPDFERTRGLILSGYDGAEALAIDEDAGYLYVGIYPWPVATGTVLRVSLSDMVVMGALVLAGGNVRTLDIGPQGQYLYVGCEESAGNDSVAKIRLSDFTEVDQVTLSLAGTIHDAAIDASGQYGYYGLYNDPWDLCRIRLSDMTHVSTLNGSYRDAICVLIDPDDEYLYVASGELTTTMVTRVDLATFTEGSSIDLQLTGNIIRGVMDEAGVYMYFTTRANSPSEVCQVAVSPLASLGAITMQAGEDDLYGLAIDNLAGYLYVATDGSGAIPSEVIRLAIPALTRVDALTLNSDEYDLRALVADESRGYVYGGFNYNPGRIVEIGGGGD